MTESKSRRAKCKIRRAPAKRTTANAYVFTDFRETTRQFLCREPNVLAWLNLEIGIWLPELYDLRTFRFQLPLALRRSERNRD